MPRRYSLKDEQWEKIKESLPGREGYVGGTAKNNRLFVEAVIYRYRSRHSLERFTRAFWVLEEHPPPSSKVVRVWNLVADI